MIVRVLGPVTVNEDGSAVRLPGSIPARILALLTTSLTSGLRTDALVEGIWGDRATAAAPVTLQSHVARLRKAIGADRLLTTSTGYRLALPPASIDAHQFVTIGERGAALLADGRPAEAGLVLRDALALWRGEAFEGLEDCELLTLERARLAQLRFDTLLARLEADVSSRPSRTLVTEIEAVLETNPTNERLWVLLMRAWHAVGDSGQALAVFGRARTKLLEELGLEPGAELRAVQADILDPDTDPPTSLSARRAERRTVSVVAVSVPVSAVDPEEAQDSQAAVLAAVRLEVDRLDGRMLRTPGAVVLAVFGAVTAREDDAERALLCARRLAAATGARVGVTSGLALVTPALDRLGPVADRAAAQALTAAPGEVVTDVVRRAAQPPWPEVPFVGRQGEIERLLAAVDDARRRGRAVVVPVIAEAGIGKSRLMTELRRRCPDVDWLQAQCDALGERGGLEPLAEALLGSTGLVPPPSGSRAETIASWSIVLAEIAATGPVVLCIEDAHWASELLLDLVDELVAAPVAAPLVLVTTARPEIEARRPGWSAGTTPLRLAALDEVETATLAAAVLAQTGARDVDPATLATASGGVPLFAVELGHTLARDAAQPIPDRLSDLMAARIDSLPPTTRDVLADAAVVGTTFWAEAIGVGPQALEPLLRREFIHEVRPSTVPGTHEYRFRHDLLKDAAYARLLRPDRAAAHLATARWWQGLGRDQVDAIVAEHAWLAHVCFVGTGLPDAAAELAATASRRAGSAARGVDAAAAVTFLQRAASLLTGHADEAAVLVDLAEALSENRLLVEADQVATRARALIDPTDGPLRLSATFLALQLDFALGRPQNPDLIHHVLTDFPAGPIHVRALGVLGISLVIGQTPATFAQAIEVSDRAIALARELGDEDTALLSYAARGRARLAVGDSRGLADMDRAQERGPGRLPPFIVLGTRQWYAGAAHHWSGPAAELRIREELEDYARRTGMEFLVSFGVAERLRCLWELGRAEECVAEADRIDRRSEAMTRWVVVQRALALAECGRLDDEVLAEVLATPPADASDLRHVIGTAVVHARRALDAGDPATAAEVLTGLGDLTTYASRDGAAEFLPRVLRLADAAGLRAFGAELADVAFEPTPLGRALTASVRGLVRRDPTLLREAVAAWEALGDSEDLRLARTDVATAAR